MEPDTRTLSPIRKIPAVLRQRPALAAILGYAAGTIVLTYPLLFHLNQGIPTLPAGDPGQHFWNIWWLGKSIFSPEFSVLHTDYLYYPVGSGLAFHAYHPLLSVFVLALAPLVGKIPAYNLVLMLGPLLSAWGLFLCAREWGALPRAAWLAGFLFLFAPFRTEIWAHWEIQSTQWIPFYLLFLHRSMLRGGIRNIFGCAVFLVFTALTAWYHLASLLFASLVLVPALAFSDREEGDAGKRLLRLAAAAVLTVILFSPYLPALFTQGGGHGEVPTLEAMHHWSADLLHYVLPVPVQKWISPALLKPYYRFDAFGNHIVYPGTALWVLAIASVAVLRRRSRRPSLLLAAGLLFVLSLGPALKCGTLVSFPGTQTAVPLPGYYLLHRVPLLNALRTTVRLGIGVTPLLALFVVVNWEGLLARLPEGFRRREGSLIAAACLVGLIEGWSAPIETHPVKVPTMYAEIPGATTSPVFEIPAVEISDIARSMYFQTFHGHPLIGGYLARPVPAYEEFVRSSLLVTLLTNPDRALDHRFSPTVRRELLEEAGGLGLRAVVVHGDRLTPADARGVHLLLEDVLGATVVAEDGPHRLYVLPEPPPDEEPS